MDPAASAATPHPPGFRLTYKERSGKELSIVLEIVDLGRVP